MTSEQESRKERRGRRLGFSCRVFFFAEDDFEGEGTMEDLSTNGCRMYSIEEMGLGTRLKLSLFLEDHQWPMLVDEAIVRWKDGAEYGLEFTSIRLAQRERLRALVMKGAAR